MQWHRTRGYERKHRFVPRVCPLTISVPLHTNDRAKEAAKQAKIDAKKAKEEAKEAEIARLEAEKAAAETAKAAVEAEQKNTAKMSAEVNGPGGQFQRCQ